jgi:hypothetical protein
MALPGVQSPRWLAARSLLRTEMPRVPQQPGQEDLQQGLALSDGFNGLLKRASYRSFTVAAQKNERWFRISVLQR